ncbi:unnamed protein product [Hyaloperonospora brassicae]|uniref:PIH1 N-terminal domain-containing protein n=1 Tax=Hyaloperonospora brassicae TaxID=162125 RepID=A0AAV0UDM2_HYABA|nr:unnamed protein product [Hyaloperonospora brassicae]
MEEDTAAMEHYVDWLNALEQTDPDGYHRAIETLQSQLQTADSGVNTVSGAPKAFKPRFPGDKIMEEGGLQAAMEGVYVEVKAGFAIKTRDMKTKEEVFVNVVSADEIQEFSEKRKLDDKGKEHEGVHVPLSLSAPHEVKDETGANSTAFDVAVNTKVVEGCKIDETGTFCHFVCELAIEYVGRKYNIKLDDRYEVQQLAYRGQLPPPKHYIRKKQAPIIEEVTTTTLKKPRVFESTAPEVSSASHAATACYDLFEEREGKRTVCQRSSAVAKDSTPLSPEILLHSGDRLIVSIQFENKVHAASHVEVELQAELLTVKAATHREMEIFLPYPVEIDSPTVCFDQVRNRMDITLLIDKSWDTLGPDCGSASWLLARKLAEETNLQVSGSEGRSATTADCISGTPKTLAGMFCLANTNRPGCGNAPTIQASRRWDPVMNDAGELPQDQSHSKNVLSMRTLEQQRTEREQKENIEETELAQECPTAKEMQTEAQKVEELHTNEPEMTYLDVEDIVRQEEARLGCYIQQQQQEPEDPEKGYMSVEDAKRVAANWSENNSTLDLQSALAFDLL